MEVERGLQVQFVVQFGQEGFRIVEEVAVPGIAGPAHVLADLVAAQAAGGILPGLVPVHINDHDVDRELAVTELFAQGEELLVGVGPVTAPPVTEDILRRHRNLAGDLGEVGQGGLVVVAVGKDVQVLGFAAFRTDGNPLTPVGRIIDKQVALALVHDSPAVAGDDTGLHRVVVVDMVRSGALVKRTGGTHQVAGVLLAVVPGGVLAGHLEGDGKIVRCEITALVGQGDGIGLDDYAVPAAGRGEFRDGKVAVDDGKGRMVFELSARGIFHTDQPVGQHGETGVADGDGCFGGGHRVVLGLHCEGCQHGRCKKEEFFHVISCIRLRGFA